MIATAAGSRDAQPRVRHVVVVGAGAFGGWTALELRRRGARVTLVDAWGPGNTRASSGGETRVIRATYGARTIYTKMAVRAMALWRAHDAKWGRGFFRKTGALWMFGPDDDAFGRASAATLRAEELPIEELTPQAAATRFPQIAFDETIKSVLWEPEAGYLFARRACEHVVECFVAEGGDYRQSAVAAPVDRRRTDAPHYPRRRDVDRGRRVRVRLRPVAGTALSRRRSARASRRRGRRSTTSARRPGDRRFLDPSMPVWVDYRERFFYGIPGNANRGFKVADDTPGPVFDPTDGTRDATPAGIAAARAFLKQRFPALAAAPLLGSEVCQYEASPDSHFIIDRHPAGRERLDRRRRIRPRLQDGAGRRRARRVARAHRAAARSAVRARAAGLGAPRRLGGEVVLSSEVLFRLKAETQD